LPHGKIFLNCSFPIAFFYWNDKLLLEKRTRKEEREGTQLRPKRKSGPLEEMRESPWEKEDSLFLYVLSNGKYVLTAAILLSREMNRFK